MQSLRHRHESVVKNLTLQPEGYEFDPNVLYEANQILLSGF